MDSGRRCPVPDSGHYGDASDGGAESWAVLASLLQTAKLNGLDPFTWLSDVLERMISGEVKSHQLDQLLAWNWKAGLAAPDRAIAA